MELALGTVQWGMSYGVHGSPEPPRDSELKEMLELAHGRGVRILDTAPVYGDIEARLGMLCGALEFQIVSKIPAVPASLEPAEAGRWAVSSAATSLQRLGSRLRALLFHNADDLSGSRGESIWSAVSDWAAGMHIRLGVSAYAVDTAAALASRYPVAVVQLPGNAFDQEVAQWSAKRGAGPLVHLRSAYLQGLLLMPVERATEVLPHAVPALEKWYRWLDGQGLTPIEGALSIVKGFDGVAACLIGVENMEQLRQLLDAWGRIKPVSAVELACEDPDLIDPRRWSAVGSRR